MPTNKDFKRLVRSRMEKTGESYTSARAQLLKSGEEASADGGSSESADENVVDADFTEVDDDKGGKSA